LTDGLRGHDRPAPRWFVPGLAALSVVAALGWVLYAVIADIPRLAFSDAATFHQLADGLADGAGYVRPYERVVLGTSIPTAEYPPLFPAVLSLASRLGLDTFGAHQGVAAAVAACCVPLVGLLGRRVAGAGVGLLAAGAAAVHPMLFQTGAALMSEALYLPMVAAVLLVTLRARQERRWTWWALAGLLAGAAALTRGEGLVLGAVVAVVALADHGHNPGVLRRRAVGSAGAVVAGLLMIVVPWSVNRTLATDATVLVSANQATVLAGANCDATYGAGFRGWWLFDCFAEALRPGDTEAARYAGLTTRALDHARDHVTELPGVAAVRMLRVWGLYGTPTQVAWESTEGRLPGVQWAGWGATLLTVVLAIPGAIVLRRRGGPWLLLLAPVAMVTATAAVTYGNQRFRVAAEPALLVLAATGVICMAQDHARRGRRTAQDTRL
jgi:4-amino-4-deoxy-L-arabinose transferase-like glycosyltransferase